MKHHIRFTAHAAVALTAVTSIALLSSVALMGSGALGQYSNFFQRKL